MSDQLFASFLLDGSKGLEIAIKAEHVTEATPVKSSIKHLPGSIDYLEGIMHLRNDIIPVLNLKKRLGLPEYSYSSEAKVAVVTLHRHQFGLLFDDIREVFRTATDSIRPVNTLVQTDDKIISAIITLEDGMRTVELLDLGHLFHGKSIEVLDTLSQSAAQQTVAKTSTYSRWVVFTCSGQPYGVPVEYARETAFFSEIDDMFKSGNIEGAIQLRENTIPVMSGRYLLNGNGSGSADTGENRVLILASDDCSFGMIVDQINEIITIEDDNILSVASDSSDNLVGIYPQKDGRDIMLLDMPNLVCNQIEDIKSLSRIKNEGSQTVTQKSLRSRHLITENCYLIFAIHKNFGIELKDVQEIIECDNLLRIPGSTGWSDAVINLRGTIVPVINIRKFYGYPESTETDAKLIICKGHDTTVALQVDHIVTIFKQEDYHSTPSLHPQLAGKKDTLDRLIEYEAEGGIKEHVLVVNLHNMVRNHLEFREQRTQKPTFDTETETAPITS